MVSIICYEPKARKLDEAELLSREVFAGCRGTLGDKHPLTLASIGNLGFLLRSEGKLDEAEPLSREALGVCTRLSRVLRRSGQA